VARLEDLKRNASVKGILPSGQVTVVDVQWHGSNAITLTYRDADGKTGQEVVYRDREPTLEVVEAGRPWSFDGDGSLFRLASEAHRIRLAYLFDPWLAVTTSLIEPLPHQITAVYERMLPRQPLRFLLADDPGSGKTIMAGLLMKELAVRGDLRRCMVVCPGMLAEQWQDELYEKFGLPFEIMTNDKIESARTGNWFQENPLVICRLDKLSRDEDLHEKLALTDWDLVVADEAHKMSAAYFGSEVKYTKRYTLGQLLSGLTRHFLLMTATPHSGVAENFQLFMALLDADRFEGRFRDGVHTVDTSDLMRRLVKEQLLTFEGKALFPERRASTVSYRLSDAEAALYKEVTDYVRDEFDRADALQNEKRKGTVGFALTILQRRLASSPEAIYQSLRRRREKLEKRLREEKLGKRGAEVLSEETLDLDEEESFDDVDDLPGAEREATEERVVDQATASQTIAELEAEIGILAGLERRAHQVRASGTDKKWEELRDLLQNQSEMFDAHGHRRKLVLFTEHRDTLNYLSERIRTLLGRSEAVVTIHGAMGREERRKAQERFTQDKDVEILVATDAAGEGINLQRAHLMVNYDLPWNPNRLEQRFGRIHRIGQTEVCHLWNLVAEETREGDVFKRLFAKLEVERDALGGAVFDVLGRVFEGQTLRSLLLEAIRYGERPEVRDRVNRAVDTKLDHEHLRRVIEERALAHDHMDVTLVHAIREEMERAQARRLQPHFIASFFIAAFQHLGGTIRERETKRYEITHVPAAIRNRDRAIGVREVVLPRYERITFEKELISVAGKPLAAFVCPGHPLLDATIDLILEQYRDLLKRGAVLLDEEDAGEDVRVLCYLEHAVQDGRTDRLGQRRIASRQLQFVEIDAAGNVRNAGPAPHLDYRPVTEDERSLLAPALEADWLRTDIESRATSYAISELVPRHFDEVRRRKEAFVVKAIAAVKDRLTKEINYWDHRAQELKAQEQAGKQPRMNWMRAQERADDLQTRLKKRMQELEQEKKLAPLPPNVIGGALVVPMGLLARLSGNRAEDATLFARETARVEQIAMQAVIDTERRLGFEPRDVSKDNCGYDIESRIPGGKGRLRFIEVKGRVAGAGTVTVTKNEILTALNKPDDFILAIVTVDGKSALPRYVRNPFQREPDFGVTSVNYGLAALLASSTDPS
jgi:superfamily II DNA or RNA helicase